MDWLCGKSPIKFVLYVKANYTTVLSSCNMKLRTYNITQMTCALERENRKNFYLDEEPGDVGDTGSTKNTSLRILLDMQVH